MEDPPKNPLHRLWEWSPEAVIRINIALAKAQNLTKEAAWLITETQERQRVQLAVAREALRAIETEYAVLWPDTYAEPAWVEAISDHLWKLSVSIKLGPQLEGILRTEHMTRTLEAQFSRMTAPARRLAEAPANDPATKRRGRSRKFSDEIIRKAIAAKNGPGGTNRSAACAYYETNRPTTQQVKNASKLLKQHRERLSSVPNNSLIGTE
jgi:hypothetical protein